MKNIRHFLKSCIGLFLLAAVALTPACTSDGTGPRIRWTPENTAELLADLSVVIETATPIFLEENPDARPKFEMALASLRILREDPEITVDDIVAILHDQAQISALTSRRGQIYLAGGRLILNRIIYSVDFSNSPNYPAVLDAIIGGLERGLAAPAGNQ